MRKLFLELEEDEREALVILCDFGVASFSAGLAVEVLRTFVTFLHKARTR